MTTWNDAIEAAAESVGRTLFPTVIIDQLQRQIRALKRPEPCLSDPAPGDTQAGLSLTGETQRTAVGVVGRLLSGETKPVAIVGWPTIGRLLSGETVEVDGTALIPASDLGPGAGCPPGRTAAQERADVVAWLKRRMRQHERIAVESRSTDMEMAKTHKGIAHTVSHDLQGIQSGEHVGTADGSGESE